MGQESQGGCCARGPGARKAWYRWPIEIDGLPGFTY